MPKTITDDHIFNECPKCLGKMMVVDSRAGVGYRRRRFCCENSRCLYRHSTTEILTGEYKKLISSPSNAMIRAVKALKLAMEEIE